MSAMKQVLFGSYSIEFTIPGTPGLLRLKSMRRYCCLCPPPMYLMARWPELFLPPVFLAGTSKLFSGVDLVSSTKEFTILNRVPGVTGLNFLVAIAAVRYSLSYLHVCIEINRLAFC